MCKKLITSIVVAFVLIGCSNPVEPIVPVYCNTKGTDTQMRIISTEHSIKICNYIGNTTDRDLRVFLPASVVNPGKVIDRYVPDCAITIDDRCRDSIVVTIAQVVHSEDWYIQFWWDGHGDMNMPIGSDIVINEFTINF